MQLWKLPCHGNATPVTHRRTVHPSAESLHPCPTLCAAAVVAVGHDVDLALLTVEDDDFWASAEGGTMKPVKLGDVPQLQVNRWTVGFECY